MLNKHVVICCAALFYFYKKTWMLCKYQGFQKIEIPLKRCFYHKSRISVLWFFACQSSIWPLTRPGQPWPFHILLCYYSPSVAVASSTTKNIVRLETGNVILVDDQNVFWLSNLKDEQNIFFDCPTDTQVIVLYYLALISRKCFYICMAISPCYAPSSKIAFNSVLVINSKFYNHGFRTLKFLSC